MYDLPEQPWPQRERLGVLNEAQVAEAFLRGVIEERQCRWCIAAMVWSMRGAWVCAGTAFSSSCDFPRNEMPELED